MARDLERQVKIVSPTTGDEASVVLESVPVYFDLGWQKAEGEDYGDYASLEPRALEQNVAAPQDQVQERQRQQAALQRSTAENQ